ncbi:FixH family protein [Cohnella sp. GCM10020058]|uniref:FixH family protein n=1 Tax=Cohnella sp. GCM10020058 TaxID=3317330 RepID=UPI00362737F6
MRYRHGSVRSSLAFALLAVALSGCTSDTDKRDANGFASYLTVDLKVTAPEDAKAEVPLSFEVKKSGQPLEQADKAEFVIWPDGDQDQAVTVPASSQSPDVYEAKYVFGIEGLYIVQSHVVSANLEAMPAKHVAIGQAAVEKLSQLEQPNEETPADSGGQHHH